MATFEGSIDVHVPVRTTYDQWTQFETFAPFMEGVEEVRQGTDTKLEDEPKALIEHAGPALGIVGRWFQGDLERFEAFVASRSEATGAGRGTIED